MDVVAKKMSVIVALFALMVVLAMGLISGVSVEVVLMRGGLVFFMAMGCSMLLFNLALKDRPDLSEIDDEEGE